jgi:hypothetical protein
MKSNTAPSGTAEAVELGVTPVLFPTMIRQYSSISSSLRGLHAVAQIKLRPPIIERTQHLGPLDVEDEDDGLRTTKKCRRKG